MPRGRPFGNGCRKVSSPPGAETSPQQKHDQAVTSRTRLTHNRCHRGAHSRDLLVQTAQAWRMVCHRSPMVAVCSLEHDAVLDERCLIPGSPTRRAA